MTPDKSKPNPAWVNSKDLASSISPLTGEETIFFPHKNQTERDGYLIDWGHAGGDEFGDAIRIGITPAQQAAILRAELPGASSDDLSILEDVNEIATLLLRKYDGFKVRTEVLRFTKQPA